MPVRMRQSTKIPHGSDITVNNNFPKKRLQIKNIPLGSTIRVDKSFIKPENLKTKMSRIKASTEFKNGRNAYKAEKARVVRINPGQTVNIRIKTS